MNAPPLKKTVSSRVPDKDTWQDWLLRTCHPVLKGARDLVNSLSQNSVELISASKRLLPTTDLAVVDASGGPVTVALSPAMVWERRVVVVKSDASANPVTISGAAATLSVTAQFGSAEVTCDGTNYYPMTSAISPGVEGQVYYTHNGVAQFGYAPWQLITTSANVTAPSNCIVRCESLTGAITVKLPAAPLNGEWVQVIGENSSSWNVTVDGNGHSLANGQYPAAATTNLVFDGEAVTLVFVTADGTWRTRARYIPRVIPALNTHAADANTVALWQGDPPGNGGSGLVDSSGNGFTLALGAGSERYGTLGRLQEGFLCDGATYWIRAGSANDSALNLVGDMTIECIVRPLAQPAGQGAAGAGGCLVNYAALGETGGNDNVLWQLSDSQTASAGPNMAGTWLASAFWETGAGVNSGIDDTSIQPLNMPFHLALVRQVVGGTYTHTFYVDGARQSVTAGGTVGTLGVAPGQFAHIGADHNAGEFFVGMLGSVKVSNVARSAGYIAEDAARCIGVGRRLVP